MDLAPKKDFKKKFKMRKEKLETDRRAIDPANCCTNTGLQKFVEKKGCCRPKGTPRNKKLLGTQIVQNNHREPFID